MPKPRNDDASPVEERLLPSGPVEIGPPANPPDIFFRRQPGASLPLSPKCLGCGSKDGLAGHPGTLAGLPLTLPARIIFPSSCGPSADAERPSSAPATSCACLARPSPPILPRVKHAFHPPFAQAPLMWRLGLERANRSRVLDRARRKLHQCRWRRKRGT